MEMKMDYWGQYEFDLKNARSIGYLVEIARCVLKNMEKKDHRPIVQICGTEDEAYFMRAVEAVESRNILVFDHTKLWEPMNRVAVLENKPVGSDRYYDEIIGDLYCGILSSGYINQGLFLPDWEVSVSAITEHRIFRNLYIPICDYPKEWLEVTDAT
jgi:hypothetical protein